MNRIPGLCAALFLLAFTGVCASEDLLIIEQDYSIFENAKDGPHAKDIRQILYITRDGVCIDEYGNGSKTPSQTFFVDIKNQQIVDLEHETKTISVRESFAERRAKLAQSKKIVQEDRAALKPGPARDEYEKMYRAMLDTDREFKTLYNQGKKEIAGVECKVVKVTDATDPAYIALEAALHPEIDMPVDNADVLYLLKIIGENMAKYLKENKDVFSKVPMEMHLDLAAGGKLDTKVVSVKKMKLEAFDPKSRPHGDPFTIPADYAAPIKRIGPAAPREDTKKEKPD